MESFNWFSGAVLPYINFLLFLGMLIYFARKPARAFAAQRSEAFAAMFAQAQKDKKEAEKQIETLKARLAKIDAEVDEIRSSAESDSKAEAARIRDQGDKLATHFRDEANRLAQSELARAQEEMENEVLTLVRTAVADQIRKAVTVEKHQEIVKQQVAVTLRGGR